MERKVQGNDKWTSAKMKIRKGHGNNQQNYVHNLILI